MFLAVFTPSQCSKVRVSMYRCSFSCLLDSILHFSGYVWIWAAVQTEAISNPMRGCTFVHFSIQYAVLQLCVLIVSRLVRS